MKYMRKFLAILLVLTMVLTMCPTAFAEGLTAPVDLSDEAAEADVTESSAQEPASEELPESAAPAEEAAVDALTEDTDDTAVTTLNYYIVHLDCGRKYFSESYIEQLIDLMAASGYTQLQLAFGNDGLRFLLDDMALSFDDGNGTTITYTNEQVVATVKEGNIAQNSSNDSSYLTEAEMDAIIAYANKKGIQIVPLLNLPGHADAILDIAGNAYNYSTSDSTLNVDADAARNYGYAILQKYVTYFANKGCQYFNFGADEFASDIYNDSFNSIASSNTYTNFAVFVNNMAEIIKNAGMTPRAFNDGFYYKDSTSPTFDDSVEICYWSAGYGSYYPAKADTLYEAGFQLINTHGDYYYVLGNNIVTDEKAAAFDPNNFPARGTGDADTASPIGVMFCIWSDYPNAQIEESVFNNTDSIINNFAVASGATDNTVTAEYSTNYTPYSTVLASMSTQTNADVSVTASGITGLEVMDVTSADTTTFSKEGYTLYRAYDITPVGDDTYAAANGGTVTIATDLAAGAKVTVFDESFVQVAVCTVASDQSITFEAPHFSVYYLALDDDSTETATTISTNVTDSDGNIITVSVTAVGITNLSVTDVTDEHGHDSESGKYALLYAYNVQVTGATSGTVTITLDSSLSGKTVYIYVNDEDLQLFTTCEVDTNGQITFDTDNLNNIFHLTAAVESTPNTKEVALQVGESQTFMDTSGIYTIWGNTDYSVADVILNPQYTTDDDATVSTDATTGTITPGKYVLMNNQKGTYLTTTSGTGTYSAMLQLNADYSVWTITVADDTAGTYYIQDSVGNYLTFGSGTSSLTSTQTPVTLIWYEAGYWGIGCSATGATYYLNNYYGANTTNAGGYTATAPNDAGSRWSLYALESEESGTEVTITGLFPGTTNVVVSDTTYHVTVAAREEAYTEFITVGQTEALNRHPALQDGETATCVITKGDDYLDVDFNEATGEATGEATVIITVKKDGVEVGIYTYTVYIINEDLTGITLTLHLWCTSMPVGENSEDFQTTTEGSHSYSPHEISATEAYGRDGVSLRSVVPINTVNNNAADDYQYRYLKGVLFSDRPTSAYQSGTTWVYPDPQLNNSSNQSQLGTRFDYIRYYNGTWSVRAEAATTWTDLETTDWIDAYYLQLFDVSEEIYLGIRDWGAVLANATENKYTYNDTTAHTAGTAFAVVYPDGALSPSTETEIHKTTTNIRGIAGGDSLSSLGSLVVALSSDDYYIEKITVTNGTNMENSAASDTWSYNSAVDWETYEVAEDIEWYNEVVIWQASDTVTNRVDIDMDPYVSQSFTKADGDTVDGIYLTGTGDAALVLVYIQPIANENNLTVVYKDADYGEALIGSYEIVVTNGVTFRDNTSGLQNSEGLLTLPENGITFAEDGSFYDGAFVYNSSDSKETFNLELATLNISGIDPYYQQGLHKYTYSILEDDKTLVLYYTRKEDMITDPTYIMDFGLPMMFPLSDMLSIEGTEEELNAYIETYLYSVEISETKFGNLTYDEDTHVFTYTPTTIVMQTGMVTIKLNFRKTKEATGTVDEWTEWVYLGIMPATTVYYEEGFATYGTSWNVDETGRSAWHGYHDVNYGTNYAQYVIPYSKNGESIECTDPENEDNYGYDDVYETTRHTETYTSTEGGSLTFTFMGTGVDLFACATADSGIVGVKVVNDEGKLVKLLVVDTQKPTDDPYVGDLDHINNAPVASISGLDHDTYTVTLYVASGEFRFTGFRIYDPMDTTNTTNSANAVALSAYTSVLEENPVYYELRDYVLAGMSVDPDSSTYANDIANKTLAQVYANVGADSTDTTVTAGAIVFNNAGGYDDVQDLLDNGPKNELYLKPGQSVTFKLNTDRQVQIGLSKIAGSTEDVTDNQVAGTPSAAECTITVGEKTITHYVKSSVDMFYDLKAKGTTGEQVYTITNPSSNTAIIAITDLKVSDCPDDEIFAPLTEADLTLALMDLEYAAPENPFVDVLQDEYYYKPVIWGSILDITNGVSNNSFAPDLVCTRSQVVTLLWRAMGCPEPETTRCPFIDVDMDEYYAKAVLWAVEEGITLGVGGNQFAPLRDVTRAEFATLLYRTLDATATSDYCPFTDVVRNEYYTDAVLWAVEHDITTGVTATQFVPAGICSRAEVVTFLYRAFK